LAVKYSVFCFLLLAGITDAETKLLPDLLTKPALAGLLFQPFVSLAKEMLGHSFSE